MYVTVVSPTSKFSPGLFDTVRVGVVPEDEVINEGADHVAVFKALSTVMSFGGQPVIVTSGKI